jgi:C-terminal processing protease CtpA/Prc
LNENIGYIYYGSFSTTLDDDGWNSIINKMVITKGLIIDIRDNNGGSVENIKRLMQHFVSKKPLSDTQEAKIAQLSTILKIIRLSMWNLVVHSMEKIVVLTNRRVFSAANMFASAMSEQSQVTLVGDLTGGGGADLSEVNYLMAGYIAFRQWLFQIPKRRILKTVSNLIIE